MDARYWNTADEGRDHVKSKRATKGRPSTTSKTERVRGRPRGNPKPLNAEERRMRNAQYERERRIELADAMNELADAAGIDKKVSNVQLLASIISRFQNLKANPPEDISELKRINANLMAQIANAESRLAYPRQPPIAGKRGPQSEESSSESDEDIDEQDIQVERVIEGIIDDDQTSDEESSDDMESG